jgi:hypothetical protein
MKEDFKSHTMTESMKQTLREKGREDLIEIYELNKAGYAGILPSGNIVDRRRFPKAHPIAANPMFDIAEPKKELFKPLTAYSCTHIPTEEQWYIVGIDLIKEKVCAAGWPPSIGELKDCTNWEERQPLTEEEIKYRNEKFGKFNWL